MRDAGVALTTRGEPSRTAARIDLTLVMLAVPPLLWAGNIVVGRAVNAQVPPVTLALARQVIGLMVLLPFAWRSMRQDARLYWSLRWQIVRLSLSGFVGFNFLVYLGLQDTSASNAQLLNSSIPVLIILFGAIFESQRLGRIQALGLCLSCAGVALIIFRGDPIRVLKLQFSMGDLIVFSGMASFALFSIWLRAIPQRVNRVGLLGAQICVAIIALAPFAALENMSGFRTHLTIASSAALLYIGIAAGVVANLFYMSGVERIGPARAGLYIHLVPLYGVLLSMSLLGESIHAFHVIGIAAIIGGLVLSQRIGGGSIGVIGATLGPADVGKSATPITNARRKLQSRRV